MPKHIAEIEAKRLKSAAFAAEGEHQYKIAEAARAEERARLKNKTLIRFKELKERAIFDSWAELGHLIERHDSPCGFYLGSNTRVWNESDVDGWLANRPTDRHVAKREAELLNPQRAEA